VTDGQAPVADGTDAHPQGAASARIASYVRERILRDELRPGDRIRQEEIADRTGASRIPVREALRMLEAEGLVEHERHKGARVPRLSMHELDVVYRMRERLEPVALAESLPQLTRDDLARLAGVQDQIEANTDLGRFIELDRAFHLGSYAGCRIDSLRGSPVSGTPLSTTAAPTSRWKVSNGCGS
jgi:DNA-binding GntR family transcriptional regulator